MATLEGIAIVGMDCRYPGAHNLEQYWENILSLRQQFRRIPDKRLNLNYYLSKDKSIVDSTYSEKASVLSGYNFDRVKYKVAKSTYDQTDLTHWLALDVAAGALRDAGFENGEGLNKKRVGVIIGNSLTGEFTRASVMRLRWPYVMKVLESTLKGLNYNNEDIFKILLKAEITYKEPFTEPNADTLAGGLSNTIAGRICNYFDFNGGGFTIDGACASSLLAFTNGCNSIINGDLDVALVGGVDLSIDPFEVIGFARNGALALNEMEVYSTRSEGFWPGEGCGIVVLMKESEAKKIGAKIFSVIKGWGISSDGNGGITRPKSETQQMAFDRAYDLAGYSINSIAMFEGHGTGTPLGDKVEITALVNSLKQAVKRGNPAILGSVKHLIGHTKAAAGVAGVIKASMALKNGIIPASRPNIPHPILQENGDIIRLAQIPKFWDSNEPMRASVLSMGFGGINVHLTMEAATNVRKQNKLSTKVSKLSDSGWDFEICPIGCISKEGFLKKIQRLLELAKDISRSEFIDLTATICSSFQNVGNWKASIVSRTPDSFLDNLSILKTIINEGRTKHVDVEKGIFFNATEQFGKIGYLFPGQGAPLYAGLGSFSQFFKGKNNEQIFEIPSSEEKIVDTSIAQPVIVKRTLESIELLERFGVDAVCGIGHSLGEITAISWGGAIESGDAVELAKARGIAMSTLGKGGGAMLALRCKHDDVEDLIKDQEVWITGYNGNGNFVIGGEASIINDIQNTALEFGIHCVRLKVSHAFHTPMMKEAAINFQQTLNGISFKKVVKEIFSTVTGHQFVSEVSLKDLLFKQIEAPVLLTQAIENIKDKVDVLIEVGPGNALLRSLNEYSEFNVIALDYGSNSLKGFLGILSAAFIEGNDIQFEELVANRFYRNFDIENWALDVLTNPCEKSEYQTTAIQNPIGALPASVLPKNVQSDSNGSLGDGNVKDFLKKIISEKTEIPLDFIADEDKIMSQLHINSLAITEIISLVIKVFNKSQKVFSEASILANSDGNILELSEMIFKGENGNGSQTENGKISFDLIPNWTHIFKREHILRKAASINFQGIKGKLTIGGLVPFVQNLGSYFSGLDLSIGNGAVYIYSYKQGYNVLNDFIEFLNKTEVRNGQFVFLINLCADKIDIDLKPLLKTFLQEAPHFVVTSLELNEALIDKEKIVLAELKTITKYKEVIYNGEGERFESELKCFFPESGNLKNILNDQDVILATGGGKGITFDCILSLAVQTGAKLFIMGRSTPENDADLLRNLNRLKSENINFKYFSADVCDIESVRKGVEECVTNFGSITACVHGAGFNRPKTLNLLTEEDFKKTLSVKLGGIQNVIKCINGEKLKLLVGFGSIIAESGMHGNADYAFANNQLALFISEFAAQNSNCRSLTLEWSVWDEVGMGVSLNIIENLKQRGVWPITVKKGVEILNSIISDTKCSSGNYIISGRYGNIPTLNYAKSRMPFGRFISKIKHHIPGIEVISEVSINLNDDVYLRNHVFQNQYVFPTVMILEGISQVCGILVHKNKFWAFDNLVINKSIFISKNSSNVIRFIVTRISDKCFKACIQSEDSNFEVNCFETIINLTSEPIFKRDTSDLVQLANLNFDVKKKFYDDLLFHTGPFCRIKSFIRIHALGSLAVAESNLTDEWFGAFMPHAYQLGDPGLNDAAIHCHQVCRPGYSLLPTSAESIAINSEEIIGPFFIETIENHEDKNNTHIDVYVFNGKGEVKVFWKNLVLTKVAGTSFNGQWDPHLLVPYIEYNINKLSQSRNTMVPLESCLSLLKSLETQDVTEEYSMDGFSILLKKQKTQDISKYNAKTNNLSQNKSSLFTSELSIVDMDEKVLIEILKNESYPTNFIR